MVIAIAASVAAAPPAPAHERRQVGAYVMRVGWAEEPAFAGVKNAVQLLLSDAAGKPVTDLPEDLKVEILFGSQKFGPLPLSAAFGTSFGRPGDFRTDVIPTRPGNYTFHFVGSLNGQRIDQSFTSSDTTFDPVQEAAAIEFPAKDPSPGEVSEKLDRIAARVEAAQSAAGGAARAGRQALGLGAAGLAAGLAALFIGLGAGRRRPDSRAAGRSTRAG